MHTHPLGSQAGWVSASILVVLGDLYAKSVGQGTMGIMNIYNKYVNLTCLSYTKVSMNKKLQLMDSDFPHTITIWKENFALDPYSCTLVNDHHFIHNHQFTSEDEYRHFSKLLVIALQLGGQRGVIT